MCHEKEGTLNNMNKEDIFAFDIYRTIILKNFIEEWGMPDNRYLSNSKDKIIEIYIFINNNIFRIASIGAGFKEKNNQNFEYLLVLPCEFIKENNNEREMVLYLLDIITHLGSNISNSNVRVIDKIAKVPATLPEKSILIDDARGEAEHLSCMHIAENQNPINLKWVIPIYYSEAKFILENGIDEFDILESKNELSLADVTRAPVV